MALHPDVQRFRQALELRLRVAFDSGDEALLDGLFTDDVAWHGAANASGEASGKAEVIELWNAFAKQGGGATVAVGDVYADGVHAAAVLELTPTGVGAVRQASIFHMGSEGRCSELWSLPTDGAIMAAAAAGAPVPEHRNLAVFRAAEEARQRSTFGPEDTAIIERFLADEVLWHFGGDSDWAEQAQPSSRDEVIAQFNMFSEATGGTLFFDIHEVFADDTHAASFVELTADRPDRPDKHMDVKEVNIFHLDSDGRAYEFWGIPTDEAERDAFWQD